MALAVVYSPAYHLRLGPHVFPADKYVRTHDLLRQQGVLEGVRVEAPRPATRSDLQRAHRVDWVHRLLTCRLGPTELQRLEIPWTPEVLDAVLHHVGGSLRAGELALAAEDGPRAAVNLGGGFHHAFPGHGEGFCALNDIAVGIRAWQRAAASGAGQPQGGAAAAPPRVLVVDCDVHQGNGTAAIFLGDDSVFTLSLHQENNYPVPKQPSDLDVNLPDGIGDDDYLAALEGALRHAFQRMTPALLWYVAGADPYRDDQLGGLALTQAGLRRRDEMVFAAARQRGLPAVVTLAGGYARRVEDTVAIHAATVAAAKAAFAA